MSDKKKKPNIIVYLADDLGYGDVSCFNPESKIRTVNFDKLAIDGMKFTDCHSSSAVCSPSRYGLLTGRYNWRSALKYIVLAGQSCSLIEKDRMTMAHMLKNNGYNTAAVGKWHLGMDWKTVGDTKLSINYYEADNSREDFGLDYTAPIADGPNAKGFDYFYGMPASLDQPPLVYIENDRVLEPPTQTVGSHEADHRRPEIRFLLEKGPAAPGFDPRDVVPKMDKKCLELVDELAAKDEPFFLYIPTPAPHTPIVPAREFHGKSGIGEYGDFVLQMDDFIGKMVDKLKELDIFDNTILIVTSYNGCSATSDFPALLAQGHNPSYKFRGWKSDIWEAGHRVPFILSWPEGIKNGTVCTDTICLTDLYATFAEVIGYEIPDNAAEDSISNLRLWQGESYQLREATVHHSQLGMYAIRQGDWKLELCQGSGGTWDIIHNRDLTGLPEMQLYNLKKDIGEQNNLVDEYPEKVTEMKKLLKEYILNGRSTPGEPQPNAQADSYESWPGLHWFNEV